MLLSFARSNSTQSKILSLLVVFILVMFSMAGLGSGVMHAALQDSTGTLVVNSLSDDQLPAGECLQKDKLCLRNAIRMAYQQNISTITFNLSGVIQLSQTIYIQNEGSTMQMPLTIDGNGQSISVDGGDKFSLFGLVDANITLNNLTLQNGHSGDEGGGAITTIRGSLTITNSTLFHNISYTGGGAILSQLGTKLFIDHTVISHNSSLNNPGGGVASCSDTTIVDSTISGNSAIGGGGGIFVCDPTTIESSTVSDNTTPQFGGGGILIYRGNLTLRNSTLSGNSAGLIGAIVNSQNSTLVITNSTIAGNTSNIETVRGPGSVGAGGIYNDATSHLILYSTLLAKNTGIDLFYQGNPTISEPILVTSLGHNLIGNQVDSGLYNGLNHDQIGTLDAPLDPKISPLASNGGPTQTMALIAGSPAIGTGNCGGQTLPTATIPATTVDQRGAARANDGSGLGCDIGAFEHHLTAGGDFPTSAPSNTATNTPTLTTTLTYTPTPSNTNTFTPSFTPSNTATATLTPTATSTPTMTLTPSITPTNTSFITVNSLRGGLKKRNELLLGRIGSDQTTKTTNQEQDKCRALQTDMPVI